MTEYLVWSILLGTDIQTSKSNSFESFKFGLKYISLSFLHQTKEFNNVKIPGPKDLTHLSLPCNWKFVEWQQMNVDTKC